MKAEVEKTEHKNERAHAATVEEALNITGFGKYNFGLLLVCTWTLQAMGLDLFGVSFTVAAAVCDLQLTMQQRSLLTATPLIGVVLGAHLWGYVSDNHGRRLSLIISMTLGFVFAALSSLSPDWITMCILKLLSATFTSASNSSSYTLLGESCSEWSRGRAMLMMSSAIMCSQAIAAVFAYPILPLEFSYWINFLGIYYRPWRLLVFVHALPCATAALLLPLFYESPKFLMSRGEDEKALEVLRCMYVTNTGKRSEDFPIHKLLNNDSEDTTTKTKASFMSVVWQQTIALFKAPHLKNTLQLFYLVIIIYVTGSGFILWLPYIMNNLFLALQVSGGSGMNLCTIIGLTDSGNNATESVTEVCDDTIQESTLLSAILYGAIACVANIVMSLAAGRRKRIAMMFVLSLSTISSVLINLVPDPIAGAVFFFIFLLCALSMGILSVYFVELYPTHLRGMASCVSVMVGRTSAFFGVNLIGAMLVNTCDLTFYVWATLLFSTVVFTWYLPKDNQPQK